MNRIKASRIKTVLTVLCLVAAASTAGAMEEMVFLTDSAGFEDGGTKLFRVHINQGLIPDSDPPSGYAELELLIEVDYDQVDALACNATECWLFDKYWENHPVWGDGGFFGRYDFATDTFYDSTSAPDGKLYYNGSLLEGVVLAAFHPDGTLFVANEKSDTVFTVDTSTGQASLVGQIDDPDSSDPLDIAGADIVFGANGAMYLWTNISASLYELTLPASFPGTIGAVKLVDHATSHFITGLAVRGNGWGPLLGSVSIKDDSGIPDHIHQIQTDGSAIYPAFRMREYDPDPDAVGPEYRYLYGDMASVVDGELCTYTIGYWKNHDWNNNIVSICGGEFMFDEASGKTVLWNARNRNFSMFFAQLIAAKLNVGGMSGVQVIEDAEAYLCTPEVLDYLDGYDPRWSAPFASNAQQDMVTDLKDGLDWFNNTYHCEESEEEDPEEGGNERSRPGAGGVSPGGWELPTLWPHRGR